MLETMSRLNVMKDVHRLANLSHSAHLATKKSLTMEEVTEVIRFERDDVIKELMEGPFKRKLVFGNKFGPVSRFSNGEWPVFYAAIGRTTAEKESTYLRYNESDCLCACGRMNQCDIGSCII